MASLVQRFWGGKMAYETNESIWNVKTFGKRKKIVRPDAAKGSM